MNTWIIEPNGWAWALFAVASISLGAIAVRMWHTPKNGAKWDVSSNSNKIHFGVGELYKTTILTAWLSFSAWLMWGIYNNPILSSGENFWSNLIAILAIIVATLIGWQIYSAMDWSSKIERISRMEDGYSNILKEVVNNRNFAEASVLLLRAQSLKKLADDSPEDNKNFYEDAYRLMLRAIKLYTSISVEEQILNCIMPMYAIIESMGRYGVGDGTDFQEECDVLYNQIKEHVHLLTLDHQGRLKDLHNRRKAIAENNTTE